MGLSSWFGNNTKRLRHAQQRTNAELQKGYDEAVGHVTRGIDEQLATLNEGYDAAGNRINAGYDTAEGRVDSGYDRAEDFLQSYYGAADDILERSLNDSTAALDPFVQSGTRSQDLYDTALGLNGSEAANDFYAEYAANDPYREFNEDLTAKAVARAASARGQTNAGRTEKALANALLERGSKDLDGYLNRLAAAVARGGQYASQVSSQTANSGTQRAGLKTDLGTRLSGLASNRGLTLADLATNRGIRLGDLDYKHGINSGGIQASRGATLGNMAYGHAQQRAANEIGTSNAVIGSKNAGINNLAKLIGQAGTAALNAYTPGISGLTAAGSFA